MNFQQHLKTSFLILSALGFGLGSILPAAAVSFPRSTPSPGAPSRTASGAPKRNTCKVENSYDLNGDGVREKLTPMTALAPADNTISSAGSILSIFVYIPQNKVENIEIEVSEILDVVNPTTGEVYPSYKEVYLNGTVSVPERTQDSPRIASFRLDDLGLQKGKKYEWTLSLMCNDASVDAVIGRIDCTQGCSENLRIDDLDKLSSTSQILAAAQSYASQGFWNETVYLTAKLRDSAPEQWSELLRSQGLDCLIDIPSSQDSRADFSIENDPQCFVDQDIQSAK